MRLTKRDLPRNGWYEILKSELDKVYFKRLKEFVDGRAKKVKVYPNEVYRALTLTPPTEVRVVIMGQDPYHGTNQANGLAFSVNKDAKRIPPSLRNIFQELGQTPTHGDLTKWTRQGVLLLNSVLTVERGNPGSHTDQGWEKFTDAVLKFLIHQDRPIIFVLWGLQAQAKLAGELKSLNLNDHFVLTALHPSPHSAKAGFFECDHFNKINKILDSLGQPLIDWKLDETSV